MLVSRRQGIVLNAAWVTILPSIATLVAASVDTYEGIVALLIVRIESKYSVA